MIDQAIFKAYDIRGTVPDQINEEVAEQIGRALGVWLINNRKNKESNVNGPPWLDQVETGQLSDVKMAVGRDVRIHSPELAQAVIQGLTSQGVLVIDVGIISTPMAFYIIDQSGSAGGIVVTASHNPKEYNGFKIFKGTVGISDETGIKDIGQIASREIPNSQFKGQIEKADYQTKYLDHLLTYIQPEKLKPLKFLFNPNFGSSCLTLPELEQKLPGNFTLINGNPDGTFPKGKPDPNLPVHREETSRAVIETKSDLGVSFDADSDRLFLVDHQGQFVPPYFTAVILAQIMIEKNPGATIIHDSRLTYAIDETVARLGGRSLVNRAGRSFFGERMKKENALLGSECSGHYFFRDYYYGDDALLAFLYIWDYLSEKNLTLADLVKDLRQNYFISEEQNFTVSDNQTVIQKFKDHYKDGEQSELDGLAVTYPDWRFSLRSSNTEPVIRLNLEARSQQILDEKQAELISLISLDSLESLLIKVNF